MKNSVLRIGAKSIENVSSASWSMNSMVRKLPSTCPTTDAVAYDTSFVEDAESDSARRITYYAVDALVAAAWDVNGVGGNRRTPKQGGEAMSTPSPSACARCLPIMVTIVDGADHGM
jgi:hypothetical protein